MPKNWIWNIIFFALLFVEKVNTQELLLPNGDRFKQKQYLISDGEGLTGNGFLPATEKEFKFIYSKEYDSLKRAKSWINRKLFNEHFFEIKGEDYYLSIDPLVNLHLGQTNDSDSINLFQNTRAFQLQGEVMGNVAFYTAFFENQARFASFQTDYFEDRGEQRYSESKGHYDTINATVPGGGRTKPFKEGAFDYASAISYFRYRPADFLAIQFGNTPSFVGWGYRSMLLSDNSFNFTNLRLDWSLSEKWSFTTTHGKQLNLFRRIRGLGDTTFVITVEEPYEKKNFSTKYLAFEPNEKLSLGLFEAQVYFREDSIHSEWMHPLFANPLPFLNTAIFGWENRDAKSLIGLNAAWNIWDKIVVYGQFVTDDLSSQPQWGSQIGFKSKDFMKVQNLFIQAEYNVATNQLYAAENRRLAYAHFNLPLAHSLGNGFNEFIGKLHYEFKRVYVDFQGVFYRSQRPITDMNGLFNAKNEYAVNETEVVVGNIELGYLFNERTNLSFFVSGTYRQENTMSNAERNTIMIFAGIKTGVFNRYFDF